MTAVQIQPHVYKRLEHMATKRGISISRLIEAAAEPRQPGTPKPAVEVEPPPVPQPKAVIYTPLAKPAGQWAESVDALAMRPKLTFAKARDQYADIPVEVLQHIFAERARRGKLQKERGY